MRLNPASESELAEALESKGFRLGTLGRNEEAVLAYDEMMARFGDATEANIRLRVSMANVYRRARLQDLGRIEEG